MKCLRRPQILHVDVLPFSLAEARVASLDARRIRGGFPRSFLADDDEGSWQWRDHYVRTFLERDIPGLGIRIPPIALRRFWMMLAHYHGQVFNASEIARSLGVADTTASRYLDVLAGTYMVRRLPPWFENIGKRIGYEVKYTDRPKTTRSQHLALERLHLDQLTVVVPGDADYPLADGIRVCGLNAAVGDRGSRAGS